MRAAKRRIPVQYVADIAIAEEEKTALVSVMPTGPVPFKLEHDVTVSGVVGVP
ncbi:hypothetical protein KCP77_11545 [Salmonella enterica subsp. enterica]|nr:hypothetical protein KCP77_11545 [Salmonella enterica subsp. enterica]